MLKSKARPNLKPRTPNCRGIIAKTGLLLSRGTERIWPLPGPRGSNFGLAEELNYLLKLFTIRSKTGGCISAGGGVAATSWLCIVCRQSGRMGSVQAAHAPGGNLIEGAGIYRRT